MFMVPTAIFSLWFMALWSFGLLAGSAYLLHEWYERSWQFTRTQDPVFHPVIGGNIDTAFLAGGIALGLFSVAGGFIVRPLLRAFMRSVPAEKADNVASPQPVGVTHRLRRTNGSEIQVESFGPEDGFPVVLSHGWGDNRREWEFLRRDLTDSGHRLITWDLPGLGNSDEPAGKDYRMESFASDLDLVLRETCGEHPAVLAGHSIGGMATLTFCKVFPEALGTRVAGLILVHTTYINPVRTSKGAAINTVLEKPLLVPLLYLTIALSPLLRLSGWMSYQNGSAHLNSLMSGFAGTQTWEQLDFSTRFILQSPPAVVARGMLGMLQYDAEHAMKTIPIPALIVCGDRDTSCVPEASQRMTQDIPRAELVTLTPANHMGLVEHHHEFARIVREFITTCFKNRIEDQALR